jgi:hypothetical protein
MVAALNAELSGRLPARCKWRGSDRRVCRVRIDCQSLSFFLRPVAVGHNGYR